MSKFSLEAFRKACGESDSLALLAEQPKGPGARFSFLHQPFAIVGRNKVSDIILSDQRVSRRHAYLQVLNGAVFCVDLSSHGGIHWQEGSRLAGWFGPTHSVRLGGYTLRLIAESPADRPVQALDPLASGCLEKPIVTLEFLNGGKSQAEWPVDRLLTLMGSSPFCKLCFRDPKVAQVHASLVCTREGAWVVDLLSATGMFVNGQRVRLARLEDRDELRIGDFAMKVHCRPGTNYAVRPSRAASHLEFAQCGATRSGQITKADFGPTTSEIGFESGRLNTQALDGLVEPSGKAMLESVFFPMVQQFSAVQNQMFDQFQQGMALMFQTFGTLQKGQIDVLRAELDRVQILTREIQTLQLQMNVPAGCTAGRAGYRPLLFGNSQPVHGTSSVSRAERSGNPPGLPGDVAVKEPPCADQSRPAANSLETGHRNGTPRNGTEVHALLCERMAELQEDRRSRMQKMVDFLSGK